MRAPVVSTPCKLSLAAMVLLLVGALVQPAVASASQPIAAPSAEGAPMLASLMASGAGRISAAVALEDAPEPVVGSFKVDGLTYASLDGSRVMLVSVDSDALAFAGAGDSLGAEGATRGIGSGVPTSPQPQLAPSAEASGLEDDAGETPDPMALALPEFVDYAGIAYAVAAIGPKALASCDVDVVVIPATVESVDEAAFRGSFVAAVEVAEGNVNLSSFDGALYDADMKSLLLIPEGKQGAVRIPSNTESIPPSAFSHCALVTSVSVDAGSAAYLSWNGCLYDASGTTLLAVPAGAESISIREGCAAVAPGALAGCARLRAIEAPASLESVPPEALGEASGDDALAPTPSEGQGAAPRASGPAALAAAAGEAPRLDPALVAVSLPENADASPWQALGFSVRFHTGAEQHHAPIGIETPTVELSGDEEALSVADLPMVELGQVATAEASTSVITFNVNGGMGSTPSVTATYDSPTAGQGTQYYHADGRSARSWDKAGNVTLYAQYGIGYGFVAPSDLYVLRVSTNGVQQNEPLHWKMTPGFLAVAGSAEACYVRKVGDSLEFNLKFSEASWSIIRVGLNESYGGIKDDFITYYDGYAVDGFNYVALSSSWTYLDWSRSTTRFFRVCDQIAQYKVSYHMNGGAGQPSPRFATVGAMVTAHTTLPTRVGYSFDGWWSSASGGTRHTDNSGYCNSSKGWTYTAPTGPNTTLTFYAHWQPIRYTVSYVLNGGTVANAPTAYTIETANWQVPAPTRPGCTFLGWVVAGAQGAGSATSGTTTTVKKGTYGNLTASANWKANSYSITYVLNGGTISGQATAYTVDNQFNLVAPSRPGYTFAGWTVVGAQGAGVTTSGTTTTVKKGTYGNLTASAKWTANRYLITYNLGGGTLTGQKTEYHTGDAAFNLAIPTRAGYTFAGWTVTGAQGAGIATSGTTTTVKQGAYGTLAATAKWTPVNYSIGYNLQGGSGLTAGKNTQYSIETPSFALEQPSKAGHTFTGWSVAGAKGAGATTSGTTTTINKGTYGNLTATANWRANGYEVSFDPNGGTGATPSVTATYGAAMPTISKKPTRAGYAFLGYYDTAAQTGGAQYYGADLKGTRAWDKAANTTLYARWGSGFGVMAPSSVYVHIYNYNGTTQDNPQRWGLVPGRAGVVGSATGARIRLLNGTVDCKFLWKNGTYNMQRQGMSESYDGITKLEYTEDWVHYTEIPVGEAYTDLDWDGRMLYFVYNGQRPVSYLSFNANGGTGGQTAKANATYGQPMPVISKTAPVRAGFRFTGWYDAASGGNRYYDAGGNGLRTWTGLFADTTLYAHWESLYEVSFDVNGGEGAAPAAVSVAYGDAMPALAAAAPKRAGYAFQGWYDGADFTTAKQYYTATGTSARTYDLRTGTTLYAGWKGLPYSVSIDYVGGYIGSDSSTTVAVRFGTQDGVWVGGATRPGYALVGYADEKGELAYAYDRAASEANGWPSCGGVVDGTYWDAALRWRYAGDVALHAEWEPIGYTIVLDGNAAGADVELPVSEVAATYDQAVELPSACRYGYSFDGWDTRVDGTGSRFGAGMTATAPNLAVAEGSQAVLYAQWTLHYDLDVPVADPGSITFEADSLTGEVRVAAGSNATGELRSYMAVPVTLDALSCEGLDASGEVPDSGGVPELEAIFGAGSVSRVRFAATLGQGDGATTYRLSPGGTASLSAHAIPAAASHDVPGRLAVSYGLELDADLPIPPVRDAAPVARLTYTVSLPKAES